MLLLNQGMMQFIKHPYHRNDLNTTSQFYVGIYSGGDLSPAEINSIKNGQLNTGRFNYNTTTHILGTAGRTQLIWNGLSTVGMNLTVVKSNGSHNEIVLPFSKVANVMTGLADDTAGLLRFTMYTDPSASNTTNEFFFTIGLPGSGADIELDEVEVTVGKRFRLNDIVINIQNLLGEA